MPAGRVMNDSLRCLCRTYSSRAPSDGNGAENTKVEKKQDKRSGEQPPHGGLFTQLINCSQFQQNLERCSRSQRGIEPSIISICRCCVSVHLIITNC